LLVIHFSHLFRLLGCCRPGLRSLLPVAPDQDHGEKGAHHCRTQQCDDDGNSDCPHAWREEALKRMVVVDKWLRHGQNTRLASNKGLAYHQERPQRVVQENSRGSYEHSHAHEFVQLQTRSSVLCMEIRVRQGKPYHLGRSR